MKKSGFPNKLVLLAGLFVALFATSSAIAETILFFSPARVLVSDKKPVAVVNVSNTSDKARAYKISAEDLIMTAEGVTAPVDTFEYSAKRMIRFVPRSFTIQPGERQTIRIMMRVPSGTADGDYHTHLRFLEDITQREALNPPAPGENRAGMQAPFQYETMIPVILSHGDVKTELKFLGASLHASKKPGSIGVSVEVARTGNGQGTAYVEFLHEETGQKIGGRGTMNIYRELDSLKKDYDLPLPDGVSGGTLRVTVYDKNTPDAAPIGQKSLPLGR